MTAECLEILSSELKPLKEAEADNGLLPQVLSPIFTYSAACTPALQTQWQPVCFSMLMLAAADCNRQGCYVFKNYLLPFQYKGKRQRAKAAFVYSCIAGVCPGFAKLLSK